jgi:hypothetical protein
MFYKYFIIRIMGALAPFLCLVRTFRVGFHSALRSKGPKYDIRPLGISPPRPVVSAPFFSASSVASVSFAAFVSAAASVSYAAFFNMLPPIVSSTSFSSYYYYFSFERKYFIRDREREAEGSALRLTKQG